MMQIDNIYSYEINGVKLSSGDLIATTDGNDTVLSGQFWRLIGKMIPGDIDHIVIYIGPDGRCLEANGLGVKTIEVKDNTWNADNMVKQRGGLIDSFYGGVFPITGNDDQKENRLTVANYCLRQLDKPYNLNFFNSETEESFYCSQLAYKAYQNIGINLNTGIGVPNILGTSKMIFPQEIWNGFNHVKGN